MYVRIYLRIHRNYIDNITNNQITETLSKDYIFSDINYQCHLTTYAKLINEDNSTGVVCVDHIKSSVVRKLLAI